MNCLFSVKLMQIPELICFLKITCLNEKVATWQSQGKFWRCAWKRAETEGECSVVEVEMLSNEAKACNTTTITVKM